MRWLFPVGGWVRVACFVDITRESLEIYDLRLVNESTLSPNFKIIFLFDRPTREESVRKELELKKSNRRFRNLDNRLFFHSGERIGEEPAELDKQICPRDFFSLSKHHPRKRSTGYYTWLGPESTRFILTQGKGGLASVFARLRWNTVCLGVSRLIQV